jgi:hypothetical protein
MLWCLNITGLKMTLLQIFMHSELGLKGVVRGSQ